MSGGAWSEDERRAIGLYAVAARDAGDFLEMLPESSVGAVRLLYEMLTKPNSEMSESDRELNALLAPIVGRHLAGRT